MMSEEYEVLVAQPVDMFPHTSRGEYSFASEKSEVGLVFLAQYLLS